MSDEAVAQPEDNVLRADVASLQEQLKSARAERDRQIFEKSEIVAKANVFAQERDDLKGKLAAAVADRDRLAEAARLDLEKIAEANRRADAAARRADEAAAEIQRLRQIIDTAPSNEPLELLWTLAADKTRAGVAWARAKIPSDSPALPWFDKTVETVTALGCATVKLTKDFVAWATPRVIALTKQGAAKVEELLAKK